MGGTQAGLPPSSTQADAPPTVAQPEHAEQPDRYTLLDWRKYRDGGLVEWAVEPEGAVIGEGAMGRVLLAMDQHIGRVVAIKEMKGERRSSATGRFLREARVTGALEHPGIVPVHEIGERPDRSHFYTMRLVRGRSLGEALDEAATLRERLALLPHVTDLCHAIAFAHSQGVIHRDLKPDNVMVGAFGETVVLDWGLARAVHEDAEPTRGGARATDSLAAATAPLQTAVGILGTPAYMAPEQATGRPEDVDEASDLWALGAILYQLLTGELCIQGETTDEVLRWLQDGDDPVRPVRELCKEAPRELASVAMRCLQRAKAERYADAREMARDLERYQSGERVVAHRYGVWELLSHVVNRNRPLSAAVGVAALVAVAAGTFGVLARQARVEAEEYKRKNAFEQLLLAREALDDDRPLEAEARLRRSLEDQDTLLARALWSRVLDTPLLLKEKLETEVTGLDFAPDGTRLAVASASPDVVLLDSWTGVRETLPGPGENLYVVRWGPEGRELAAGSGTGQVVLWPELGAEPRMLEGHEAIVSTLAFDDTGRYLLSGSFDGTVRLWDLTENEPVREYRGHEGLITSAAWSPSHKTFASGGADQLIRIWERESGEIRAVLEGHEGEITGLAWADGGHTLISSSYDGTVRSWDVTTGKQQRVRTEPATQFTVLGLSASGDMLAAADKQGRIHSWSPLDAERAVVLEGQGSMVFGLALDAEATRIASGGIDRTVYLWSPTATGAARDQGHEGVATTVDFLPDGALLASSGWDGAVRIWQRSSGRQVAAWHAHDDIVHVLRVAPDGRRLATGSADRTVRIQDADSGRLRQVLTGHYGAVRSLAYAPGGEELATAGDAGLVYLWDLATESRRTVLDVRGRTRVAFAPTGRVLAMAWASSGQARLRVLDLETNRVKLEVEPEDSEIESLSFSADGATVHVVTRGGRLRAWDLANGAALATMELGGRGLSVSVDPTGRFVAAAAADSASADATLSLLDTISDASSTLTGHRGQVADAAFDGTGAVLATAGFDGTVRSWDPSTGRPAWRGTGLLPDLGLGHSHRGWLLLGEQGEPAPELAWARAVCEQAHITAGATGGGTVCIQTRAGALERWDTRSDNKVGSIELPPARTLLAAPSACAALLHDGRAVLAHRDWEEPLDLAAEALAIGKSGHAVIVARPGLVVHYDLEGFPLLETAIPFDEPTAAVGLPGRLLVGERHGAIAVVEIESDRVPAVTLLQDTPTTAVSALAKGPGTIVVAGFDDGTVGLWDRADGAKLLTRRLHGAVRQLAVLDGRLHALTELGAHAAIDLAVLERDRCTLLREVWERVPVCWEAGGPQACEPPRQHACLAPAQSDATR